MKESCTSKFNFNFSFVEKVDVMKEIKMLESNKTTQNTDIPTKLIKGNTDIFAELVFISLKRCIEKLAKYIKKPQKSQKKITNQSVFRQIFLKRMRSSCLNKCLNILNFFIEISVWIQEAIQCPTLSIINVRKIETCY